MAQRTSNMGLFLVVSTIMWAHTWAQPNCAPTIVSLSPCLGYITGNSSTPSSSCCTQLATVVQTQAQCLCSVLSGGPQLPFAINQTQALTLPGACKIQTPPISQCNASTPATAPASSTTPPAATVPSQSPPSNPTTPATPSVPSAPSGSGSKTVPTTGQSSSSTSTTKFTPSILFLVFLTSALSSF